MQRADHRMDVVDKLHRLGDERAIERGRRIPAPSARSATIVTSGPASLACRTSLRLTRSPPNGRVISAVPIEHARAHYCA